MIRRVLLVAALVLATRLTATAGGPAFVAGSGFDANVKGRPLTWAHGNVQYFTDQGDLSAILPAAQADAFVADAFARWTAIPTVSLSVSQAGHLAEDVNGGNVSGSNGTYSIPPDIQPSATATPVGVVYDADGQVTNALLGQNAGSVESCFYNAAYGGPDNFSSEGSITHALVVINGVCAAQNPQLPEVRYRLVRVIGRVLGLGWSQANINVQTQPPVTDEDKAGFPLVHFTVLSCVPIEPCFPDASTPRLDDRAAISRLYPVEEEDRAPTHAPVAARTGRIHGSVFFTDAAGNPAQPMQGVNVVARRVENGQPSRRFVATSVSGFAFRGNAGNPMNGYVDAHGIRYDRFGSDDPALEGFFDLAGLEIPEGAELAQYQISVEAINSLFSSGVGPYAPYPVAPSGSFTPVVVTVRRGDDVAQTILMRQSAVAGKTHVGSGSSYATPAKLPPGGGWGSWISGYGSSDWFQFNAQADRTASVTITTYDETGQPTLDKLIPAIGMWLLEDQSGGTAPSSTLSAFNAGVGMTRLDTQFNAPGPIRLGIADLRGDGRPDYFYTASILYSDSLTPARASMDGGVITLSGIGFHPGLQVTAGGNHATVLSTSATGMSVAVPSGISDGVANVVVTDPANGGFSRMYDALTYGAAATDQLLLVQGQETSTPVGAQAGLPIRVRAVAADGVTPVNGATVAWSADNGTQLSACLGRSNPSNCSALTDAAGLASTWLTPTAAGQSTITAALAPAVYPSAATQKATLVANPSSDVEVALVAPTKWIGQGATIDVTLTAQVLKQGVPQPGTTVNFQVQRGTASLATTSNLTDGSGFAVTTAHLSNHSADVQVSACVTLASPPCQNFTLFATPRSLWKLETVSGAAQEIADGEPFDPLMLRVTDGTVAANSVTGVVVTFQTTFARLPRDTDFRQDGDTIVGSTAMPVILGTSTTQVVSDANGVAKMTPDDGGVSGPCELLISATAGNATAEYQLVSGTKSAARDDGASSESRVSSRKSRAVSYEP
jgi:hypothetical protein